MENKRCCPIRKRFYMILLVLLAFSGFGQMPIYKRYYLADIPGLGWSADFFVTHALHNIGAAILLALIGYAIVDYFLLTGKRISLTRVAYVEIILMGGIVVTGAFRVMKNMPDIYFSPLFVRIIDLSHLMFAMIFLFSVMLFIILRKPWAVNRN